MVQAHATNPPFHVRLDKRSPVHKKLGLDLVSLCCCSSYVAHMTGGFTRICNVSGYSAVDLQQKLPSHGMQPHTCTQSSCTVLQCKSLPCLLQGASDDNSSPLSCVATTAYICTSCKLCAPCIDHTGQYSCPAIDCNTKRRLSGAARLELAAKGISLVTSGSQVRLHHPGCKHHCTYYCSGP